MKTKWTFNIGKLTALCNIVCLFKQSKLCHTIINKENLLLNLKTNVYKLLGAEALRIFVRYLGTVWCTCVSHGIEVWEQRAYCAQFTRSRPILNAKLTDRTVINNEHRTVTINDSTTTRVSRQ